jgi:hypothetical protein
LWGALSQFSWCAFIDRLGHKDLTRPGCGLGARGSVDYGADCSEVMVCPAKLSETHLTTVDAYANADCFLINNGSRSREGPAPLFATLLNFARREHSLSGMIIVAYRKIEKGHDRVADSLVEQPTVIPNGLGAFVVEGVKHF